MYGTNGNINYFIIDASIAVYTQWGHDVCQESTATLIYKGRAVAGNGKDPLCVDVLPTDEENEKLFFESDNAYFYLKCALCMIKSVSTIISVPGSNECPESEGQDWIALYSGYLATVSTHGVDFICVKNDSEPVAYPEDSSLRNEMNRLKSIKCSGEKVQCAVCSLP